MYQIGIDVGSTYTKYCVMDKNRKIIQLFSEKTPIHQKKYFEYKIEELLNRYPQSEIISCGYGKKNINSIKNMNELIALAKGSYYLYPMGKVVLDIGGQDTKIIWHEQGKIKEFFVNDKCAAGSGMFLANTISMLGINFEEIDLTNVVDNGRQLSSVCAVFAQSEIINLIANNVSEQQILCAVIRQIFIQAKKLFAKIRCSDIILSGGLTQIKGIQNFASTILEKDCIMLREGSYMSAIGCTLR